MYLHINLQAAGLVLPDSRGRGESPWAEGNIQQEQTVSDKSGWYWAFKGAWAAEQLEISHIPIKLLQEEMLIGKDFCGSNFPEESVLKECWFLKKKKIKKGV